jgi:hypothetical protein
MRRTSTLFEYPATWNSSTQHISVLAKQRRRTWKHCQDGYPYVTYSNSSLWPGSELLWFQAPHVTCWPLKGTRWVLPLVQEPRFQKSVGILSLASNLELLGRFEGLGSWSQAMARAQCAFQTQSILDRILSPNSMVALVVARCELWDRSCNPLGTLGVPERCEFWDRSCNPLGTSGMSDCSRCGVVPILMIKEILRRDLDKEVFYRKLAQRFCQGVLLYRPCTETS